MPNVAQRLDLLLGAAADDRADGERHGARVEGGLVVRHEQVVVDA